MISQSELETIMRPHLRRAPAPSHVLVLPPDQDGIVKVSMAALEANYDLLRDVFTEWSHGPPAPKVIVQAWACVAMSSYNGKAAVVRRLGGEDANRLYNMWQYCWRLARRSKTSSSNGGKKVQELKRLLLRRVPASDSPRDSPCNMPASSPGSYDYSYPAAADDDSDKVDAEVEGKGKVDDAATPTTPTRMTADAKECPQEPEDDKEDDEEHHSAEKVQLLSSGDEEGPEAMERDLIHCEASLASVMRKPSAAPVLRKPSAVPVLRKPITLHRTVVRIPRGLPLTFVVKKIPQRGRIIVQIRCVQAKRAAIQVLGEPEHEYALLRAGQILLAAAESKTWTTFDECKVELRRLKASDRF